MEEEWRGQGWDRGTAKSWGVETLVGMQKQINNLKRKQTKNLPKWYIKWFIGDTSVYRINMSSY